EKAENFVYSYSRCQAGLLVNSYDNALDRSLSFLKVYYILLVDIYRQIGKAEIE
ncbi:1638_t:CDS:1, partial [Gigaspora margarita]